MGLLRVTNIIVKNPKDSFLSQIHLNLSFEVLQESLPCDLKWEAIYVGSAEDNRYDQVLDSFVIQDLTYGSFQFDWDINPPDHSQIPSKYDLLDSTILILYAYYDQKKFFKCCYVVGNRYEEVELLENDPEEVIIEKVIRDIRASDPKVTELEFDWTLYETTPAVNQVNHAEIDKINLFEIQTETNTI